MGAVRRNRQCAHRSAVTAQLRLRWAEYEGQQKNEARKFHWVRHWHPKSSSISGNSALGFHAEGSHTRAHSLIAQGRKKCLHPLPFTSTVGDKKIIVLRRDGQKTESVKLGHRLDGDAPVGA